jgi:outer membrane protein TolC
MRLSFCMQPDLETCAAGLPLAKVGFVGLMLAVCAGQLSAQGDVRSPSSTSAVASNLPRTSGIVVQAAFAPNAIVQRLPAPGRRAERIEMPHRLTAPTQGNELEEAAAENHYVIDLPAALRLADGANPEIGLARESIRESLALQQGARALLLPTLTAGTSYHNHTGNLQRSGGSILGNSQQVFYFGGGAGPVGAGTVPFPAVRIYSHLGDAIFEPLAARQRTAVRRLDANAKTNSVLLNVSTLYLNLMAAEAQREVLWQSRQDVDEVVRVTANFAQVGQGRQADADRARTAAALIHSELRRADEQLAVSAARLAGTLNLDPSVRLKTVGGPIPILRLVDPSYRLPVLIDVALNRRPELAARNAEIVENQLRYRQERARPLLPTIDIDFSAGVFGGGSNLVSPAFGNFSGRSDFNVIAFWTVQNLGLGNSAIQGGRRAATDQANAARTRTVNLIRSEVAEAYGLSMAALQQVTVSEKRLTSGEEGFREELNRINGGQGLPIELLDNLNRAVAARQAIVAAITAYDRAQFQLFVALGQPPTLALPNAQALQDPGGN